MNLPATPMPERRSGVEWPHARCAVSVLLRVRRPFFAIANRQPREHT